MNSSFKLRYYPYATLRQQATLFEDFDNAQDYFQAMLAVMYENNGCGLAANQVGLLKRIFVMDVSKDRSNPLFIANPEIIDSSSELHVIEEACLSLPGISCRIWRPKEVLLRYCDENGIQKEMAFSDLASSCVQHEIDHLNGKMFPDRAASAAESKKLWKKYTPPK